eukprot:6484421-Amphidinium_carterae.1
MICARTGRMWVTHAYSAGAALTRRTSSSLTIGAAHRGGQLGAQMRTSFQLWNSPKTWTRIQENWRAVHKSKLFLCAHFSIFKLSLGVVLLQGERTFGGTTSNGLTNLIKESKSSSDVIELLHLHMHGPLWNQYRMGAVYAQLVKLKATIPSDVHSEKVISGLVRKTQEMAEAKKLNARAFASLFWAIAKLSKSCPVLVQSIPTLLKAFPVDEAYDSGAVGVFNGHDMSNMMWAAATLLLSREDVGPMLRAVLDRMRYAPELFNEQGLSNILWAAAVLRLSEQEVLPIVAAVGTRMQDIPDSFREQALSNIMWAVATLQLRQADVRPIMLVVSGAVYAAPSSFKEQ